jgi:hypothetical protein
MVDTKSGKAITKLDPQLALFTNDRRIPIQNDETTTIIRRGFSSEETGINLQVNPSYEFDTQRSILLVQLSRGASAYIMGKFASKKDRWCQSVRGCYQAKLPYGSVGAVRLTPTLDLARDRRRAY